MTRNRSIALFVCLFAGHAVQAQSIWKPTGSLRNARMYHTETLLQDGQVLHWGNGYLQPVVYSHRQRRVV